jgi:autotransporter-associated beta strand protein
MRTRIRVKQALVVMVLGLIVGFAQAQQTFNWVGPSGGYWGIPANWHLNSSYPQALDTAVFTGTVAKTVNMDATTQAYMVNVTNSAAWTWALAMQSLTVGAGGFNYGSTGASSFNAVLAGAGAVRINQGGVLTLSNTNNTFTGGIEINAGRVYIPYVNFASYRGQLGSTNRITIGASTAGTNDAVFNLAMLWDAICYITNPITIRSGNSGRAVLEMTPDGRGSPPRLTGPITLEKDVTLRIDGYAQDWDVAGGGIWNLYGSLDGSGTLIKEGFGLAYLYGDHTRSGTTLINGGELSFSGSSKAGGDIIVSNGVVLAAADTNLGVAANTVTLGGNGTLGGFGGNGAAVRTRVAFNRALTLTGNGGVLFGRNDTTPELNGPISGSGRLLVLHGYDVACINTNNTYSGGTVVASGGLDCTNGVNNNTYSTGDISVEFSGHLVLRSANNMGPSAKVYMTYPASLILAANTFTLPEIDSSASGRIVLPAAATTAVDPIAVRFADGTRPLGTGNLFLHTSDTSPGFAFGGTSLWAFVANDPSHTYRLAGGRTGGLRTLSLGGNPGPLVDVGSTPHNVIIGDPSLLSRRLNGNAVFLSYNQAYSGTTTVNRGCGFIGSLRATGNPFGDTNGPVFLNGGTLQLNSSAGAGNVAAKGTLTFTGDSTVWVESSGTPTLTRLQANMLVRTNRGALAVHGQRGSLSTNERFMVVSSVPASLNGMVAPYFWDSYNNGFVDYPNTNGFVPVGWNKTSLATALGTDKVNLAGAESLPAAGVSVYALKSGFAISANGNAVLTNHSGGLILTGNTLTHSAPMDFGTNEAVVIATLFNTLSGKLYGSGGLTKSGAGALKLTADSAATFSGDVTVNQGSLRLPGTNTLGPVTVVLNGGELLTDDAITYSPMGPTNHHNIVLGPLGGGIGTVSTVNRPAFNGNISGPGALTLFSKNWGFYIQGTNNTYSGGTYVDAANDETRIYVATNSRLGTGDVVIGVGPTYSATSPGTSPRITLLGDNNVSVNSTVTLLYWKSLLQLASPAPRLGGFEGCGGVKLGVNPLSTSGQNCTLTTGLSNKDTVFYGRIEKHNYSNLCRLIKAGTGTLTLWGENSYDGGTVVSNGTLVVNNWVNPAGWVQVLPGATLDGIGTVGIVSNLGGTVKGSLYARQLVMNSAASNGVTLSGTSAVSQYDQLHVSEGLTLGGGTLTLTLGFVPAVGQTFTILNNTSSSPIGDQFACGRSINVSYNGVTYAFAINYAGGDGNDIVLTVMPRGTVFSIR